MYENQQWMPVGTFFGLLGCPVPTSLKAQLLKTLAAFAKTPSIATTLWISMESAQVSSTTQYTVHCDCVVALVLHMYMIFMISS